MEANKASRGASPAQGSTPNFLSTSLNCWSDGSISSALRKSAVACSVGIASVRCASHNHWGSTQWIPIGSSSSSSPLSSPGYSSGCIIFQARHPKQRPRRQRLRRRLRLRQHRHRPHRRRHRSCRRLPWLAGFTSNVSRRICTACCSSCRWAARVLGPDGPPHLLSGLCLCEGATDA